MKTAIGPYNLSLLREMRQPVTLSGERGAAVDVAPHGHQLAQETPARGTETPCCGARKKWHAVNHNYVAVAVVTTPF